METRSNPLPPSIARLDLMPVEEVMHHGVIDCDSTTPLVSIAALLARERIHCVIVTRVEHSPGGERIAWGAISATDVMRALDADDAGATAGRLATTQIITIERRESVARAVRLMAEHDIAHVVVVDREYPVGLVSALDVARAASGG